MSRVDSLVLQQIKVGPTLSENGRNIIPKIDSAVVPNVTHSELASGSCQRSIVRECLLGVSSPAANCRVFKAVLGLATRSLSMRILWGPICRNIGLSIAWILQPPFCL